jgi:CHAT domain-containing protein
MLKLSNSINDRISVSDVKKQFANGILTIANQSSLSTSREKSGTNYVVSTLWTVDEISSALIMIEFYRRLRVGTTPTEALKQAKHWLCTITYPNLAKRYNERAAEVEDYDLGCYENLKSAASNAEQEANKKDVTHCPYTHPYYWAGFTVTGKVSR